MRKLIINKGERAASHHDYIYEDGKKTEIPDDGVVFLYKDKYGLLHASEWEDIAAESGKYAGLNAEGVDAAARDRLYLRGDFRAGSAVAQP